MQSDADVNRQALQTQFCRRNQREVSGRAPLTAWGRLSNVFPNSRRMLSSLALSSSCRETGRMLSSLVLSHNFPCPGFRPGGAPDKTKEPVSTRSKWHPMTSAVTGDAPLQRHAGHVYRDKLASESPRGPGQCRAAWRRIPTSDAGKIPKIQAFPSSDDFG